MSQTTYLITGANRGIGLGLTSTLLLRPNTTVIAASRSTASNLSSLPKAQSSRLVPVIIDATNPSTAQSAIASLSEKVIDAIDVVIANAGIADYYGRAEVTPLSEMTKHFEVNVLGVLSLYQATVGLVRKGNGGKGGKFVGIGTGVASIGDMEKFPMPVTAYGTSKAAMNYVLRKIHFEEESLVVFSLTPGWVQTDMGNLGARSVGMESAPVTIEQSVEGILGKIDNSTREATGGTFQSFDTTVYSW